MAGLRPVHKSTDEDDLRWLEKAVDLYGGDLARWPSDDRGRLQASVARSDAALRLWNQARALDRLTGRSESLRRAAEVAGERRSLIVRIWPFGPWWQPAGALAMALILGVLIGFESDDVFRPAVSEDMAVVAFGPEPFWDGGQ